MKNAFHWLINGQDMDKKRISEFEDISIKSLKTQKQIEKKTERERKREQNIQVL